MRLALTAALLVTGCKIDLDLREVPRSCEPKPNIPVCVEAESESSFEWIQANILTTNCSGDACHGTRMNGLPPDGKIVFSGNLTTEDPTGVRAAYTTLMGADGKGVVSDLDDRRKLVVPGNAEASYLFFLMRGVLAELGEPPFDEPPESIGYMPMDNDTLCCQKIDAVARWIEAGALPPAN